MDPISLTTSVIAFVDITTKLAHGCLQLYHFWGSIKDAPEEVKVIRNDLQLLANVLEDIGDDKDLSPSVRLALESCQHKLDGLQRIVQELDMFTGTSKRQRLWTAFRVATRNNQLKSFREGLSSLKSTLMLGLMYQSVLRPKLCFTSNDVQVVQVTAQATRDPQQQIRNPVLTKVDPKYESNPDPAPPYSRTNNVSAPSTEVVARSNSGSSIGVISSSPRAQSFLQHTLHVAVDNLFKSGTVEQLMSDAVKRVTSFDTSCRGSYGEDGPEVYTVDGFGDGKQGGSSSTQQDKSPPLLKRARVCHQTSSMGVLFGSIWIRTSTLKVEDEATASAGRAEVITSFIFYPSSWLGWFGFRSGTEANLKFSPNTGWKFNVTPVRAVPENSLVFDLCRVGDVKGVTMLLSRGDASVKDTSPKGWTPLHFAAASGHANLCAALIEAGADKAALAYQGPTENALSPVSMWAEMCQEMSASEKIHMMRVFYDCLDLSEASGEGWVVIHSLVGSMSQEKVRMADTGVNWFLRKAQSGMMVGMGPQTVWDALQHSLRAFLLHEHEHLSLHRHLGLDPDMPEFGLLSQVTAISNLLAISACARKLLPMPIEAAIGLGVNGFDTAEEYIRMTKRQFVRAIPQLYVAWCKTLPRALETVGLLIEAELDLLLAHLGLDRTEFSESIRNVTIGLETGSNEVRQKYLCGECGTSYANIGAGLVQPRRISFEECRIKEHKMRCQCLEFLDAHDVSLPMTLGALDEDWEEAEEELYTTAATIDVDELCREFDALHIPDQLDDLFHSAILILYRMQGRQWLGEFGPRELVCGVCFLRREQYLGKDGSAKRSMQYTPMPENFVASSNRATSSTF